MYYQGETAWGYLTCKVTDQWSGTDRFVRKSPATLQETHQSPPAAPSSLRHLCAQLACACCPCLLQTWVQTCCLQFCPSCFWGPTADLITETQTGLHPRGPGFRPPWELGTELLHQEPCFPPNPFQHTVIWNPWLFHQQSLDILQTVVGMI